MFHHIVLIVVILIYGKKVNAIEGRKNQLIYSFKLIGIFVLIPLIFDVYNTVWMAKEENIEMSFPRYNQFQAEQKNNFKNCVWNFGPFGRLVCPELFKDKKSLLIPTNENLSERLNKCRFNHQHRGWSIEDRKICDSALKEVTNSGDREIQLALFNRIVDESKHLECRERHNIRDGYIMPMNPTQKGLEFVKKEWEDLEYKECIENLCSLFCLDLRGKIDRYFPSLMEYKDYFKFEGAGDLQPSNFIVANAIYSIGRDKLKDNLSDRKMIRGTLSLSYFYKIGKIQILEQITRDVLSKDLPKVHKKFDYSIFKDEAFLQQKLKEHSALILDIENESNSKRIR